MPESLAAHQKDPNPANPAECDGCPLVTDRRAFVRNLTLAVAGAMAAGGIWSENLLAAGVRTIASTAKDRYELPPTDGISVDEANEVIIVRWRQRAYAFSSRCPHKGHQLEWRPEEGRVFCPKHKARFLPDGTHVSGRGSRPLDRFSVRLEGNVLAVDFNALHRIDKDPVGWANAVVVLPA